MSITEGAVPLSKYTDSIKPPSDNDPAANLDEYEIVDKHYQYNPATEDLVFADKLQNGQVVLADEDSRMPVYPVLLPGNKSRVLKNNRWCTVSELFTDDATGHVYFIGIYEDGTKAVRSSNKTDGWIIKKEIPSS